MCLIFFGLPTKSQGQDATGRGAGAGPAAGVVVPGRLTPPILDFRSGQPIFTSAKSPLVKRHCPASGRAALDKANCGSTGGAKKED